MSLSLKVGIITASDRGAKGQREDLSGQAIRRIMEEQGHTIASYRMVADEQDQLAGAMANMADLLKVDVILTTGGTGLGPRDVTPEATLQVATRRVPGIPEAMRLESLKKTNRAMLSRAEAAVRGKTLIVNLPGSVRAVEECLAVVLPVLEHAAQTLRGAQLDCGNDPR